MFLSVFTTISDAYDLTINQLVRIADTKGETRAFLHATLCIDALIDKNIYKKPKLYNKHTLAEAKEYIKSLEKYEIDIAEQISSNTRIQEIYKIIDDFIMEYSGLNSIPEEYRKKAYKKAYDKALVHCNPPNPKDIYNNLKNLIEVFY